ncbi:MAG TPA: hypothetical protein VH300_02280 [Thermoleophilaceae bacterium]|nr:hypothetical protein [Thermoleophilaceae bacterium]
MPIPASRAEPSPAAHLALAVAVGVAAGAEREDQPPSTLRILNCIYGSADQQMPD